jgi:hypothetical protein
MRIQLIAMAGTIYLQQAIKIAEDYFKELYHEKENAEAMGLPPNFSWIGFDLVEATEESKAYIIKCEVKPSMFSSLKHTYVLEISKEGVIMGVKRV